MAVQARVGRRRGSPKHDPVMAGHAISAAYQLFEWIVAEATGEAAEAFLGTQGYAWDTQSDMLMALVGAAPALSILSRLHNRQIDDIQARRHEFAEEA